MTSRRWWIAIALLLAATIAMAKLPHGAVTELKRPLQTFPLEIADWHGFDQPLTDRITAAAGVDSYISRFYFQPGGDSVGLYVGYYKSQQTGEYDSLAQELSSRHRLAAIAGFRNYAASAGRTRVSG